MAICPASVGEGADNNPAGDGRRDLVLWQAAAWDWVVHGLDSAGVAAVLDGACAPDRREEDVAE